MVSHFHFCEYAAGKVLIEGGGYGILNFCLLKFTRKPMFFSAVVVVARLFDPTHSALPSHTG